MSLAEAVSRRWEQVGVAELATYIEIACLSPAFDDEWQAHGALEEAACHLADFARRRLAADVEVLHLDSRTPLITVDVAAAPGNEAAPTTLIYGHLDKQPALGEWRSGLEAFVATREGERLYGRGTADDGYALFATCFALEAIAEQHLGHGRVFVMIEASEESGSPDLEAYLDSLRERIGDPGLVICLDSGCATYDRLWVTTSLRGNLVGTLRVDVLDEGVHSGIAGGVVPSSFRICRALLDRIEDATTGDILLGELLATIPEQRRLEIEAVAAEFEGHALGPFASVEGLRLEGRPADQLRRMTWEPALAVIGACGLPPLAEAGNVLRPFTALKLSFRLPPSVEVTTAATAIQEALETDPPYGARVRFTIEGVAAGFDAPGLSPELQRVLDEASLNFFGATSRAIGLGGSIPFLAALGARYPDAQFLATGVLGPESNAHGPNEFLHLPTVKSLTAVLAHIVAAYPGVVAKESLA